MIELVILTGVYGAGKTSAIQCFEEAGYFVSDNIPAAVVDSYLNEIEKDPKTYTKVALTVESSIALKAYEIAQKHKQISVKFVGLTCDEPTLNERYRLSRTMHPKQSKGESLEEAIKQDIQRIKQMTDYFDFYIDTSKTSNNELRNYIFDYIIGSKNKFTVSFYSFGYKISVPQDIETVFDVRLLPNPYWVSELKNLCGLDKEVKEYVLNAPETKEYLKHVISYLDFYLEKLKNAGRNHASIGIACSGGQHRSVVIAEYLANYYGAKYLVSVSHKDLKK